MTLRRIVAAWWARMMEATYATVDPAGNRYWHLWRSGKVHRKNGPAMILANGREVWFIHGRRHRIGGPASENGSNEFSSWYVHECLHRVDGPAHDSPQELSWQWWLGGLLHRIEGAAQSSVPNWAPPWETPNSVWYLEGRRVPERHWSRRARRLRFLQPGAQFYVHVP